MANRLGFMCTRKQHWISVKLLHANARPTDRHGLCLLLYNLQLPSQGKGRPSSGMHYPHDQAHSPKKHQMTRHTISVVAMCLSLGISCIRLFIYLSTIVPRKDVVRGPLQKENATSPAVYRHLRLSFQEQVWHGICMFVWAYMYRH